MLATELKKEGQFKRKGVRYIVFMDFPNLNLAKKYHNEIKQMLDANFRIREIDPGLLVFLIKQIPFEKE